MRRLHPVRHPLPDRPGIGPDEPVGRGLHPDRAAVARLLAAGAEGDLHAIDLDPGRIVDLDVAADALACWAMASAHLQRHNQSKRRQRSSANLVIEPSPDEIRDLDQRLRRLGNLRAFVLKGVPEPRPRLVRDLDASRLPPVPRAAGCRRA